MKTINLTRDKKTAVSDKDYRYLLQWKWFAAEATSGGFYAIAHDYKDGIRVTIYMHRLVAKRMKLPMSKMTDHRDGNSLNNQRRNLRPATHRQNVRNRRINRMSSTGFRGVTISVGRPNYRATIVVNRKHIHLGMFDDKIEAAKIYNKAAIKYFGKFARLNEV